MKAKDWRTYWRDMAPRIDDWMESKRDREVGQCVAEAFALYSFMMEDFHDQVTKNRDIFLNVGSLLVQGHDVLRAIVPAQATLSTTALAALVRIAIEIRSTLLFIIKSTDAERFSDRFARFSDVEKVLHHEKRAKDMEPVLTEEEIARIEARSPKWFAPETRSGFLTGQVRAGLFGTSWRARGSSATTCRCTARPPCSSTPPPG